MFNNVGSGAHLPGLNPVSNTSNIGDLKQINFLSILMGKIRIITIYTSLVFCEN